MGVHSKFDKLQDEFIDVQLHAARALVCLIVSDKDGAEKQLKECFSNHYLQHLLHCGSLDDIYPSEFRVHRNQLQLL